MEDKIHYSVCPYNCWPVNCGIKISVTDNETIKLSGNKAHDVNRGKLCVKGQSALEIQNNDNRLINPLKRIGARGSGKWETITWDEAIDEISLKLSSNIKAGNSQANAIYHSHGNIVQRINWKILTPRFANMNNITLWDGNFPCWYDVGVAQKITGYWGLHDPADAGENSSALINWAQDPCASMANMIPHINRIKESGGKIITIDPRVTQTASISDVHIQIKPGTDIYLANSIANILITESKYDHEYVKKNCFGFSEYKTHIKSFTPDLAAEKCNISREQIFALADLFSKSKPLCINLTRGALGKHWNGVQMVRGILSLSALSGNIGIKGGGVIWGEALDWNLSLDGSEKRSKDIHFPENNYNSIDSALEKGIVNTLLIIGGNPLSQWPDLNRLRTLLNKLDLVVVNDIFFNHTAREVADIILPGTTWLEELGLRTSNRRIYIMDKVKEPLGNCREASWWMEKISKKLGIIDYFPWKNKEECLNDCLKSEACNGATVDKLRNSPEGLSGNFPEIPYSDGKFQSISGKFEFYSQEAEKLGINPLPVYEAPLEGEERTPDLFNKYPLSLISSRKNTHFHSFHNSHMEIETLKELEPMPLLAINPIDAMQRELEDGDLVNLFNDRGKGKVRIEVTTEVPAGLVSLNDSWPELNIVTDSKAPVSPEVTSKLGMGGQPAYQNVLVEIEKIQ